MRRSYIAWAAAVVPIWIVLILCTHWEPVAHDGWGHWSWHRNIGLSVDSLLDFAWGTYTHNNPRLGQVLTLLVYTPGPWHAIVTPVVELALFYLCATLVLGRWPSLRRAGDALLFATIFAMAALTVPSFGMMLFSRPFTGNYLFGFVINLALLVPYRLHYESARRGRWWGTPAMLVLGAAAGLCNEHTGPALAAMVAFACVVFWRRGDRLVPWAIAGLLGLVAGGVALFLAPGQAIRYNGLATEQSTVGRVLERGLDGNLKIVVVWLLYLLPLVLWAALGAIARRQAKPGPLPRTVARALWAGAAFALAITLTLLLSPKQGPRLYLASVVIACTVVAGWVVPQLASRWSKTLAALSATAVLGYMTYRCVPTYHTLGREFAERVAILEAAPDHSVADIPSYTVKRTRWSVGDDLLIEKIRSGVSGSFALALIRIHTPQRVATEPVPEEP